MIIRVCYFTGQGKRIADQLFSEWKEPIAQVRPKEVPLEEWTADCFARHLPILFICACGIAVRSIAPFVKDKLLDSPVLVMDERGNHVISLLSGHMGGANRLAERMAGIIGANPVVTTATDVEGCFAVDVFALKNGFDILNRDGIRILSAKLLRGEEATVAMAPGIAGPREDTELPQGLRLVPYTTQWVDLRLMCGGEKWEREGQSLGLRFKEYVLGIGCRKGKSFEELQGFLKKHCPYDLAREVFAIASIDLKKQEEGLWGIAQYYHIPFITYSSQELAEVPGRFTESDFVREVTGVSNVCERAALRLAYENLSDGEDTAALVQEKIADDGMTLAIGRIKPRIRCWKE